MLEPGEHLTLAALEMTGPAPVTATHKRDALLLMDLSARGLVEIFGSPQEATMAITDKGREALAQHWREKKKGDSDG
jgi:hypothetical protein